MIRSIESLKHVQHVNKHITDITTRPHILKVYISCHCTKSPLQIIRWKCEHPTGKSFIVKVTKVNSTAISLYRMVGNHTWRLSFGAPEGHIRNQYSCRYTVQIEKVHVHRRFNRDRLPQCLTGTPRPPQFLRPLRVSTRSRDSDDQSRSLPTASV